MPRLRPPRTRTRQLTRSDSVGLAPTEFEEEEEEVVEKEAEIYVEFSSLRAQARQLDFTWSYA